MGCELILWYDLTKVEATEQLLSLCELQKLLAICVGTSDNAQHLGLHNSVTSSSHKITGGSEATTLSTTVASQVSPASKSVRRTPKRAERIFFCALAAMIAATVVLGFAKSYFFVGLFAAKLPSALVHIHGAVFTSWIMLLVTQVVLVSIGRVSWHKGLGVLGMFLAPLMIVLGFATLIEFIRRPGIKPPLPILQWIAVGDTLTLFVFAFLVLWAFYSRRDGATHKRLILLASITILGPAIGRFSFVNNRFEFLAVLDSFLVLLVLYDLWTRRSLHRATVWGMLLTIGWQGIWLSIGESALMTQVVVWVQRR